MRRRRRRRTALIKSNNPHLAGGEKPVAFQSAHVHVQLYNILYMFVFLKILKGILKYLKVSCGVRQMHVPYCPISYQHQAHAGFC